MKLTFMSVNFWVKQMAFHMWVVLIQSVESLKRKDWGPMKREFYLQMAFRLKLQPQRFPGFPACWTALQNLGLPVSTSLWNNSLNFFLSLSPSHPPSLLLPIPPPTTTPGPQTHTHTHTHTHYWFNFSGNPKTAQRKTNLIDRFLSSSHRSHPSL